MPSRFLQDLPVGLIEGGSARQRRTKTVRRASSWQWRSAASEQRSPARPAKEAAGKDLPEPYGRQAASRREPNRASVEQQYRTGQRVRHQKFGDGVVIESKLTGNDEEVVVAFSDEGLKKLVASLARLQVLE